LPGLVPGIRRAGRAVSVSRQCQPAEIGELFPDGGTEAERIGRDAAAVIDVIGLGNEAIDAFAQQPLLVA